MQQSAFLSILAHAGLVTWITVGAMGLLSVGVWSILIRKWSVNRSRLGALGKWERQLGTTPSLQDFARLTGSLPASPMTRVTLAVLREIEGLSRYVSYESLSARGQLVNEAIERTVDAEKERSEGGMTYLAFCTATGPLIGLLGTVWGIMDTFMAIGRQGSANITVVAPGIAEALLAVLSGLIVAIPASLGYNAFAGANRRAESYLYNLGSELLSAFKRADLSALDAAAAAREG